MRIWCIGSVNFDVVMQVPRLPKLHEKLPTSEWHWSGGGAAANTAYWLARLGHEVCMGSVVGADPLAAPALESLSAAGVDVDAVCVDKALQTGVATIFVYDGQNNMVVGGGASRSRRWDDVFERLGAAPGDHLHFDSRRFARYLEVAGAPPKAATCSVELNGAYDRDMCAAATLSFCNSDELDRITDGRDAREFWQAEMAGTDAALVLTKGDNGADYITATDRIARPAMAVTPADRTGGGDAFDAGFLHAWLRRRKIDACLDAGLRLAAAVIQAPGARPQNALTETALAEIRGEQP